MTPAMDGLFGGPASERRRFLDRLVLAVDGTHSSRVNALERRLRSRNRLLEQPSPDAHWLDAIEHETAEVAIAVAAARAETVRRLAAALARNRDPASPFPWAGVALDGWVENALMEQPATEVEDRYRAVLRENRARDAAAGRTTDGPHLTDLEVLYGPKGIAAAQASTGEQKALLIGLVLAHAGLVAEMTRHAPLLLLDEVVAHLDPGRRAALYDALAALDAQVWMTGADPAPFADVAARAQMLRRQPGPRRALRETSALRPEPVGGEPDGSAHATNSSGYRAPASRRLQARHLLGCSPAGALEVPVAASTRPGLCISQGLDRMRRLRTQPSAK